ncbi:hypothetical protein RFI_17530 [Reticulomyxa filosa]|uniref:Uncharacterized protein n=1 Tax=Reticulomyxa filosa TaxID=46433 RepID=X6N1B1_RETFI|nr:hypothetical protein RFI_17530 [Reticulomyxa filosa]|eukprot:ETO19698.1 hypothetical protein RFI_17530 [Reticulomyxa filosa]
MTGPLLARISGQDPKKLRDNILAYQIGIGTLDEADIDEDDMKDMAETNEQSNSSNNDNNAGRADERVWKMDEDEQIVKLMYLNIVFLRRLLQKNIKYVIDTKKEVLKELKVSDEEENEFISQQVMRTSPWKYFEMSISVVETMLSKWKKEGSCLFVCLFVCVYALALLLAWRQPNHITNTHKTDPNNVKKASDILPEIISQAHKIIIIDLLNMVTKNEELKENELIELIDGCALLEKANGQEQAINAFADKLLGGSEFSDFDAGEPLATTEHVEKRFTRYIEKVDGLNKTLGMVIPKSWHLEIILSKRFCTMSLICPSKKGFKAKGGKQKKGYNTLLKKKTARDQLDQQLQSFPEPHQAVLDCRNKCAEFEAQLTKRAKAFLREVWGGKQDRGGGPKKKNLE